MSAMADYLENKFIDHLFRTSSYTKPTVLAVALYTAAPGEAGGGTEVTGGAYARVSNNPLNTNWNATQGGTTGDSSGTGGLTDNAGVLTFPTPPANWGVITHFALLDAATAGNFLHVSFGERGGPIHAALSGKVLYRASFDHPCLAGYSRFSVAPPSIMSRVADLIQEAVKK